MTGSTNGSHSGFGSVECLQPRRYVVQTNIQCIHCMPASPTRLSFTAHHRWRVGRNPIGQQHNPNTGGEKKKKNETRGKPKDYTIWTYLTVRVCMCARMLMCTRVQYVDVQSHVSFISHWVHSCLFSLTAVTLH